MVINRRRIKNLTLESKKKIPLFYQKIMFFFFNCALILSNDICIPCCLISVKTQNRYVTACLLLCKIN